jgi:N-acetylmuramoyl-L-alanine amidase
MKRAWPLLVLTLWLPALARAVEVSDLRLWRAPDHTRLVLDLSGPVEHSLLQLDNPSRVVIDLARTRLVADYDGLPLTNTPIASLRHGIRAGHDLRLVLEMQAAVDPRIFPLGPAGNAGHRLVLDLYDRERPLQAPAVTKTATSDERRDIVIAIDAGHGGEDPGALGPGKLREKQVVLAVAQELHRLFEAESGFAPTLIRSGDYYISLDRRRELARERRADMFVSVHADAFHDKRARGASVYALSTRGATSTTASYLAEKENAADLIGGASIADMDNTLAFALADMSMGWTLENSLNVGASVLGELGQVARLHKKQVEQAAFVVLKSPDIPSILVETGFISNPEEARRLNDSAYRRRLAASIHRGIVNWFEAHPPDGSLLAWRRSHGVTEYTIVSGDTLSEIAARFKVSVGTLKRFNDLSSNRILVGQTLRIPAG